MNYHSLTCSVVLAWLSSSEAFSGVNSSFGSSRSLQSTPTIVSTGTLNPQRRHDIINNRRNPITQLHMFGNLFGKSDETDKVYGQLATFTKLSKDTKDTDIAFDSMSTYLQDWAKLFEGEGGKQRGLTTPVTVTLYTSEGEEDSDDDIVASAGVKLVFRPPKDNYYSKSEEQDREGGNEKKKKTKEVSPGGVMVLAEKCSGGDELRVVAKRCDIEDETIIKEMSEEAIVDDLRKAIKIWKDERRA